MHKPESTLENAKIFLGFWDTNRSPNPDQKTRPNVNLQVEEISETGRQIHLPRKQCLINRKRHRHAANEGMDSYGYAIDHMEIRPDR